MGFEDSCLSESFLANGTGIGSNVLVRLLVSDQVRNVRETLSACATQVRLFLGVGPFVYQQIVRLSMKYFPPNG